MDAGVFAADAELDDRHWWHVGRRELFSRQLDELKVPKDARTLDIGTSAGTNLRMLREAGFSHFEGLDSSQIAIAYCAEKGLGFVRQGDICALPYAPESFDLILATDVVEHVDDDEQAVREITRVLAPGGIALLTVPAFRSLWGRQDEVASHKRRYRKGELIKLVECAGLKPLQHFYFNYILFIPIFAARKLMSALSVRVESESRVNTTWLNKFLLLLFRLDVRTAPVVRPPFGVSALVVAKKARQNPSMED